MELVSEGAHATYCFRVLPRASYAGQAPAAMRPALDGAVASISQTLLDIRFLREPIGLPDAALASPDYLRYRLAIAELPSLAERAGIWWPGSYMTRAGLRRSTT